MISIKGLHKYYNKGRQNELHVIDDVTLDLPEKGMVAIFGKSGCGKTTLLNVIGGLDKFAEGSLTIDNQNILENTEVIRNKYIGYIFQNYNLNKTESCFDNVADALRLCGMTDEGEIEERVLTALKNVGMEKYSRRTPDTLSGGQQQRIAIARAIVKNPSIILADEPTGNLDETNTVMIMDLLKAISEDHLVLLVTHEANLVDFYCDKVIEISDGKLVKIKENSNAKGFFAKDKNHIYLGELNRRDISDQGANIEYYGESPEEPINIRIVNQGGKIYLELSSKKVQIIDENSEIKLCEGTFEEKIGDNRASKNIDMAKLPPIKGTRFGRLFSFKSALKSGYVSNFKNRKNGKKVLRGCMCLFAAVIVLMSSVFGTAFESIITAKDSYNHNVFYVFTSDAEVSSKLNDAVGKSYSAIDYVRLSGGYRYGDEFLTFRTGTFETFEQYSYDNQFGTNAVCLDSTLVADKNLICGKTDSLSLGEMVITSKMADALLEKSTLGYIKDRDDLLGCVTDSFSVNGVYFRIVGIVESDESAIYIDSLSMAKYLRANHGVAPYVSLSTDLGFEVNDGEAILAIRFDRTETQYPQVGETIKIQGKDIKVIAIKEFCYDYSAWLISNGIEKISSYDYFKKLVLEKMPQVSEDSDEFYAAYNEMQKVYHFDYFDYYYEFYDLYLKDYVLFESSLEDWLYIEKNVACAKFARLSDEYYKATVYKERFGRYPTEEELIDQYEFLPDVYEDMKASLKLYSDEFYTSYMNNGIYTNSYIVSLNDYLAFSCAIGETHPSASDAGGGIDYGKEKTEQNGGVVSLLSAEKYDISIPDIDYGGSYYSNVYYTVVHSSDPHATASWLANEFPELKTPSASIKAIVTPDDIFDETIKEYREEIISSFVTMAVLVVLMSVCMYFIMRSSLMNRIKEVGIYRAIGVSRRNLVFKFFIESVVLTTLTVFIGYLLTSGFVFLCLGMSSLVSGVFYYPLWLAGVVLVLLYAVSLFFGTLPIISLLRKTPSEILAQYDI